MSKCFLVIPNSAYRESFKEYVMSYKRINDEFYYEKYRKAIEDFDGYLGELDDHSKGINLPEGYVQASSFWLVDEDKVVGVVRVRHEEIETAGHIGYDISPDFRNRGYGTQILSLALIKAAELGIKEAIVTCNIENIGSRKIIEKNNGRFIGNIFDDEENEFLYKYGIITGNKL